MKRWTLMLAVLLLTPTTSFGQATNKNRAGRAYEGQKHGFFNGEEFQAKTLAETDQFLVSLDWLNPAK